MSVLDIYCHDSFCSAWITCPNSQYYAQLFIGQSDGFDFFSCLYFNLPPLQILGVIQSAKLCLFNTTLYPFESNNINSTQFCPYLLCPLLEYYTSCSYQTIPQVDYTNALYFNAAPYTVYTQIDITNLVHNWLTNKIPNKGLILSSYFANHLVAYGSSYSYCPSLKPFIRITYLPITPETYYKVEEGISLDLTSHAKISFD